MKTSIFIAVILLLALISCKKDEEKPNQKPVIEFLNPIDDIAVDLGDTVEVSVNAYDKDGTIAQVIFYLDNQVIYTAGSAPYMHPVIFDEEGEHYIKVKALDNENADSTTRSLKVDVAGPNHRPVIEFLNPTDDIAVDVGDTVEISVNAYDSDGTIDRVIFYLDDQVIHTADSTPYKHTVIFNEEGYHYIKAKALDNENADSTTRSLRVDVSGPELPYVLLEYSPSYNVVEFDDVEFTIIATITGDSIVNTSLYVDEILFGEDDEYPYSLTWDSVPAGTYSLYATAESSQGLIGQSYVRTLQVSANIVPTVEFLYPSSGGNPYMPGSWINMAIYSNDPDGDVVKDEIYANGNLIATLINESMYDWPPQPSGQYVLQARSYDDKGGIGYSEEVIVNVMPGIILSGIISDLGYSEDDNLVFALNQNTNQLLLINPETAAITNSITLPYSQPVGMDYSFDKKKLYIVYQFTGTISVFDKITQDLSEIQFSSTSDGRDIKVDDLNRRIYIFASSGFYILDLDNGSVLLNNASISGESMAVDRAEQFVFTGDKGGSPGRLYKYSIANDALSFIQSNNDCGGNPRSIEINPNGDYVVLPAGGGNGGGYTIYAYDTKDLYNVLGEFDVGTYPMYAAFTPDGKTMLGSNGDPYDNYMYVMDAATFVQKGKLSFPNADCYARITTNFSGTKVIAFSYDDYYEGQYIIYIYDL